MDVATMSKRRHYEIKDEILDALERYPQNASQLSKRIGTNLSTIKKFLEELEDLHQVQQITTTVRGEDKTVWERI